jgi:hypothetical protein
MFQAHMGFDAFYCQPRGRRRPREGRRRRRGRPVPPQPLRPDAERRLHRRLERSVGRRRRQRRPPADRQPSEHGRHRLRGRGAPAPAATELGVPTWLTLEPRVDRYARVTVRQCYYSVPAKLIGRQVRVRLGACTVTVFDGSTQVAVHERITVRRAVAEPGALSRGPAPQTPVRCPGRPRRSWPAPAERSPRRMTRSGRPPVTSSATPKAPRPWSKSCCCTATCRPRK